MKEWLPVDSTELNKPHTQRINGVKVEVSLSPYEIPRAVRGYKEASSNFFVIELKYLTQETTKTVQVRDHVVVEVGQNSGRLYKIKFDVVALGCQKVGVSLVQNAVETAIDQLGTMPRYGGRRPENYDLSKTVVLNNQQQLFPIIQR